MVSEWVGVCPVSMYERFLSLAFYVLLVAVWLLSVLRFTVALIDAILAALAVVAIGVATVRVALGSYVLQMLFYALTAPLGVAGGLFLQRSAAADPTGKGEKTP